MKEGKTIHFDELNKNEYIPFFRQYILQKDISQYNCIKQIDQAWNHENECYRLLAEMLDGTVMWLYLEKDQVTINGVDEALEQINKQSQSDKQKEQ